MNELTSIEKKRISRLLVLYYRLIIIALCAWSVFNRLEDYLEKKRFSATIAILDAIVLTFLYIFYRQALKGKTKWARWLIVILVFALTTYVQLQYGNVPLWIPAIIDFLIVVISLMSLTETLIAVILSVILETALYVGLATGILTTPLQLSDVNIMVHNLLNIIILVPITALLIIFPGQSYARLLKAQNITLRKTLSERNTALSELEQKNYQLVQKSLELEEKNVNLMAQTEATIKAEENERRRLGREIHDDLQQALRQTLQLLNTAEEDEELSPLEFRSKQIIQETLKKQESLILKLRPDILEQSGLYTAFHYLAEMTLERDGLPVQAIISAEMQYKRFDPNRELVLYRIVQETLQNALKHAQAQLVTIKLSECSCPSNGSEDADAEIVSGSCTGQGGTLVLVVHDDGKGFVVPESIEQLAKHGHWGLINFKERAESMGGHFYISSGIGAGTTIRVELPVET